MKLHRGETNGGETDLQSDFWKQFPRWNVDANEGDGKQPSLFILLIDAGAFPQQQLRHLLPLGVRRCHRAMLTHGEKHHH